MKVILALATSYVFVFQGALASNEIETRNKKIVESFYNLAFRDHKPVEAMDLYGGSEYKQHNPNVADGTKPFKDYFSNFFPKNPKAKSEIKRIIAEGDLVVLHVHSKLNDSDRGRAVVDIFRVENGKIVEHWDVGQPIPEKSANNNTMF